ncbi:MAG: ABC transporter permease [Gammaproteobacteria bacterium]|nr:ABC transporter permease [Gammaproteobacteria bacterium]
MKNILFIALNDARHQLKQGSTLVWVFVMPPIFFYFIGTVTGGFSSGLSATQATPLTVVAEAPGFLKDQLELRLAANDFAPVWVDEIVVAEDAVAPRRTLTIGPDLTNRLEDGEQVSIRYETKSSSLTRDYEVIRIQRSLYTALADIVVAKANTAEPLTAADLIVLNDKPRIWQLETSPAGKRQEIPNGFDQAVPGILVMFTLLVLLTSGGTLLVIERKQGLLRRMASAPISRQELVSGKWGGRMILAAIQVAAALLVGTFLFKMDWGPDFAMVLVVLGAWAGFCASAGLLLGSLATSEAMAGGLGVLAANLLAALGGCWWPIEVTPGWMQFVQKLTPTGWTMDALHKLISFQAGAAAALPQVGVLLVASLVLAGLAVRNFRYE